MKSLNEIRATYPIRMSHSTANVIHELCDRVAELEIIVSLARRINANAETVGSLMAVDADLIDELDEALKPPTDSGSGGEP